MDSSTGYSVLLELVNEPATVQDVAALRALVGRIGPVPPHDPGPEGLQRLAELRETLAGLAAAVAAGRLPSQGELDGLNGFLAAPVQVQLRAGESGVAIETTPVTAGWETVVRELAGAFARLLSGDDRARLRRCANPACGRFFYDGSRSRTRRWHDDACGTLVRVRRFRSK